MSHSPARPLWQVLIIIACLPPVLAGTYWLVLVSAEFLDLSPFYGGGAARWSTFALRTSLGIWLPPALAMIMDRRHPFPLRLQEGGRAALLTFFFHTLFFFTVAILVLMRSGTLAPLLLPRILEVFSPVYMCILLYVAFRLSLWLLPQPEQDAPAPAPLNIFALLSTLLIVSLPIRATAGDGPFGMPPLFTALPAGHHLLQEVFLFLTLTWMLRIKGLRMFRPAYVLLCLVGAASLLPQLGHYPLAWQVFTLGQMALAGGACLCLYTLSARKWLVA